MGCEQLAKGVSLRKEILCDWIRSQLWHPRGGEGVRLAHGGEASAEANVSALMQGSHVWPAGCMNVARAGGGVGSKSHTGHHGACWHPLPAQGLVPKTRLLTLLP